MTDLPEVRPTSCGHGFLPMDVPPAAWTQNGQHQQPVYLCADCRGRLGARRVETKPAPVAMTKVQYQLPRNPELEADEPPPSPGERGRIAALVGDPRKVPDDLGHARSAPAREWLAGYDAAKAEMPPEAPED